MSISGAAKLRWRRAAGPCRISRCRPISRYRPLMLTHRAMWYATSPSFAKPATSCRSRVQSCEDRAEQASASSRPIKNAALRFQLRVLCEKGHLTRRRIGKAYYYKAVTPRRRTFRSMARRMAEIFFGGSAAGLIAELIKTEGLSEKEFGEIERLAAAMNTGESSKRKKGGKS